MRVRILAFATATEALGAPEVELELDDGLDVGALKGELERRYHALGELWQRLAVAIDGEVVGDDASIPDGAEVALLPPVSGGRPEATEQRVALVETPIDVESVVRSVESPSRGAALLFLGNVRNHHAGRRVEQITYHAYDWFWGDLVAAHEFPYPIDVFFYIDIPEFLVDYFKWPDIWYIHDI